MKTAMMIAILLAAEAASAVYKFQFPEKMTVIALIGMTLCVYADICDIYIKIKEK